MASKMCLPVHNRIFSYIDNYYIAGKLILCEKLHTSNEKEGS